MKNLNSVTKASARLCFSVFSAVAILGSASVFAADPHVVDVLVVYDDSTDQAIQGGAETYINQIVAYTNKAYETSDMNLRLRLVHSEKIEVPGVSRVSGSGLDNLGNNAEVAQLREDFGADLVAMLAPATNQGGGVLCGIAYVGSGSRGQFNSYAKSVAYSLTGYDCGAVTFAHELGHNMGLGHSRAQGDRGGVFDYGLGHGVKYDFTTIMAYPQSYGVANSLDYFSNPRLNLCKGNPCGIPEGTQGAADSARAVNQVAEQLAAWRATVVPNNGTTPPGTTPGTTPPDPNDPGGNPADPNDPGTNPADPNDPGTNPADPNDPGTNPADPNDPDTDVPNDPDTDVPNDGTVEVTGISFPSDGLTIFVGQTSQLNPKVIPDNATNQQVRYQSNDQDIAVVSNTGRVVAVGPGDTSVIAQTDDGQETTAIQVRVNARPQISKIDEAGSFSHLFLGLFGLLAMRRTRK